MILLFLLLLIYLGIITSISDFKFGKIRNKHLIQVLVLFILIFLGKIFLSGDYKPVSFSLINFILALVVGFLLWQTSFWTAGDAKLYAVYSIILSAIINPGRIDEYPFIALMVYSFAPFFLFFVLKSLKSINVKIFRLSPKSFIQSAMTLFVLLWPISYLTDPFIGFAILIGLFLMIEKIFGKYSIFLFSILALLRVAIEPKIFTLGYVFQLLVLVLVFVLIKKIIFDLGYYAFSNNISIKNLKVGMIPAESKPSVPQLLPHRPEGITKKDIQELKKRKIKSLRIYDTIPFAPFLFAGSIIVIILDLIRTAFL